MEQPDIPAGGRHVEPTPAENREVRRRAPAPRVGDPNTPRPRGGPRVAEPLHPDEQAAALDDRQRTLQLREEQLVAHKELLEVGEVVLRTEIDQVPARLEVDASREEIEIEHEPVGKVVSERTDPWEEDGALVVPVYEEQLVVAKRLVLREHLRVRRIRTTEHQVFEETLRRERLVVDDPNGTGLVQEKYPLVGEDDDTSADPEQPASAHRERGESGFLGHLVRRALQ